MEEKYTLEEAKEILKQELRDELDKGKRCPVCTQLAKVYKRPMYATMAQHLIRLYKLNLGKPDKFYHIGDFCPQHPGDFAKFVYWGVVEEMPKDEDADQRTSGHWRMTELGNKFVNLEVRLMSHAKIYDGRFLGFTGEHVSIKDVLGKKFSYDELMGKTIVKDLTIKT